MSTGDKARSGRRTEIAQRGTIVKKEEAPTGGAACSHLLLGCAGREKLNRFDAPFARRDRQSAGKSFRLSLLLR